MFKHNTWKEISKFGAGLITGDFLGIIWVYFTQELPFEVFGIMFTSNALFWAMIFDASLIGLLVYYAWYRK